MTIGRIVELDPMEPAGLNRRDVVLAVEQLGLGPEDIFKDSELLESPHIRAALASRDAEIASLKGVPRGSFMDRVKANPLLRP